MFSTEWIEKWASALESGKYPQHVFDKSAICQPICMKYGDGTWTAIGVLVDVFYSPDWVPYYQPGSMPPIAGMDPWFSEQKAKSKVFCYGTLGSSGPIPEKVLNQDKFYPGFYSFVSMGNYNNESFAVLAAKIRNYIPEDWKPKGPKGK